MATLGQLIANALWFAFDTLDYQKDGSVPKSKLKVRKFKKNYSISLLIDGIRNSKVSYTKF